MVYKMKLEDIEYVPLSENPMDSGMQLIATYTLEEVKEKVVKHE